MLPLAIACVDAECKESWTWFLQVLCEDFGRPQNTGCVFMSDQQKGLIQAFKDLMPNIEITGIEYKKLLWTVASASTQVHFERHMTKLKEFNENAYNWVMQHDSHTWARMWELTGIPCKHAFSAIHCNKERPELYMHQFFTKATYLNVYKHSIQPVPSQDAWEITKLLDIHPWTVKKPPSRPRRKRTKKPNEPKNPYKVSRAGKNVGAWQLSSNWA
ncbi:uncharacterized protein LOC120257974 [Dioscorea cayenensis subsp. rotundata]|uniref:Uncharacterized protein LOC120257974 n=1 Tax=Dioscorea cayennensis subsp. rotundata TaxID=55577 RepID=A0AB40B2B9_DIOCR|nr:uncharacterized protein LOC120257974 [Dioscorea cayenensis subsp. rotundata]